MCHKATFGLANTYTRHCSLHERSALLQHYTSLCHPFNGPFIETTRVSQYQKSKTNLDFTEARDSEWQ